MIDVPIQVKDALRDGRLRKNYRFNVLNDDGTTDFTIDNDTLVSESVSIDERMCSGDTIKFGLCEGSSLEFQYFNHENITDRQIQAFIDIDYGENVPYSIPMGFFTVKNCSRQASTGIIKVTAYNKLQSDYLDQKANEMLLESVDDPSIDLSMYSIRKTLLEHFQIDPYQLTEKITDSQEPFSSTCVTLSVKLSDLTTDTGPINYYDLRAGAIAQGKTLTTNTVLGISVSSIGSQWSIGPYDDNYYQLLQSEHDFSALSESFVEYLKDFLDACPLTKTGSALIDEIKNSGFFDKGWRNLFGFIYKKWNGSSPEYYNDYAYKYQNSGSYPVNGTTKDFMMQLFNGQTYKNIYELIPNSIAVYIVEGDSLLQIAHYVILGPGSVSYKGAGDSIKTYPKFKYEDGSDIPAYNYDDHKRPFDSWLGMYQIENISEADLVTVDVETMPDFTLRDITSASYETVAQFGQLDRVTDLFSGVELNHSRLLPQETLYPDTALYPDGAAASATKSMYSKLWADEGNIHKWRYLIITYKGLDANNSEADFTLQRTINADGTDDYNCSDNWLFRNLIWTAEDIGAYADAMVAKMQDITWFPFEMWCSGLPYLETGDEIEIPLGEDSYTSYVLQRQLKGIQNLQDTYINGTLDIF